MINKKIIQVLAVSAALALLSSCSSNSGTNGGSGEFDGANAQGLGEQSGFAGEQEGVTYTTEAPHNQTYYFAFNDSSVNPKYTPSIEAQAKYLMANPGAHILIAGNTDDRGSSEYNIALGERRANSVAEIMQMTGASMNQIRVVSYGKEKPVALGQDEASFSLNRRDELTYESMK